MSEASHSKHDPASADVSLAEKAAAGSDDVSFQIYHVSDTIVGQQKTTIYHSPELEALYQFLDTKSQGFEWILQMSWVNESSSPQTYQETVTEGLVNRSGSETEVHFGISAAFKGLGIDIGSSHKTFTEQETSHIRQIQKTITVIPNATTYFYQKRYRFKSTVWFVNDGWGEEWLVGTKGSYIAVTRDALVEIESNEFATLTRQLNGSTTIAAETPKNIKYPSNFRARKFENITARAKRELAKRGITG